jgi:peptidoglycan-N-acetylmuramic acid deacetylase
MKDKIKRTVFVVSLLLLSITQMALATQANELNNEILAWGFRRGENHSQPVLDSKSLQVINKFNGIAMGNDKDKYVYITFDCGYEAGYTESIINTLAENDVTAAFFITGHYLNTAEDLVRKMVENGNIVGNHTVNHKCLPNLTDDEIKNEIMKLHNAVYEKIGYEMTYFRPPKGEFSERTTSLINNLGYTSVLWSSAYDDWDTEKQGREEYGKKKILDNLHNGAVILLHATSKDNSVILDDLIKEIKAQGYEIRSLNDFVR